MQSMAVDSVTASRGRYASIAADIGTFVALMRAGFRRYSTYRQATFAGAFTNTVFGFLKCYVLLAVAAGAAVAGYDPARLATFVWFGQGLLAVVLFWGWTELAERIRSGDVVSDLLRPVHPVTSYLAADLGRAGHAAVTRMLVPVLVGPLFFPVYVPHRWPTVSLFAISVGLAVVISFGCRYLVNAVGFWMLDVRGPMVFWALASGVLSGLYFPLRFLPDWLVVPLWLLTPLPSLFQTPLDVLVEVDPTPRQVALVALQAVWAVLILLLARFVQRRAEHRLVVQGG
ncbi:ABC transporter permease [Dactylosporangium sp. CA-092794]|uniref:ABC transporter permease n=1 Tax=Dactylosporangium sp. CA-092794 TaxID=3239929 RepID=UPI003D924A3E